MSTRQHRIHGTRPFRGTRPFHGTRPLYLVIALAGLASIATSMSPLWGDAFRFEGPTVTLDPDQREVAIPLTIRFSPEQDLAAIEVRGSIEFQDADEELRLSLVEPGLRTLAAQFQSVAGDGRLFFHFDAPGVSLRCARMVSDVCEQELAVVFTTGGARTGAYVIGWHLSVQDMYEGSEPPDNSYFEVALADGRAVDVIPPHETVLAVEPDGPGNDRWRLVSEYQTDLGVAPEQPSQSVRVVVTGKGPYTTSELRAVLSLGYNHYAPQGLASFRTTVIPDEPAAGVAAEHVAMVSGGGALSIPLSIPEPLDCVDEIACERGFTIRLEGEALEYAAFMHLALYGVIEGDGDGAPANTSIEIVPGVAAGGAAGIATDGAAGGAAGSGRRQDG